MPKIDLIVSDIDGCLTSGKAEPLDLARLEDLRCYNRSTVDTGLPPLSLCTGRPQPYVEVFCQILSIQHPCICENGALLYDPQKDCTIYHPDIDPELASSINTLKTLLIENVSPILPFTIEPGKDICLSINPAHNSHAASSVTELFEIVTNLATDFNVNVTHSKSAVDITPKGIDKGAGLAFLSTYVGVPTSRIAGIGDSAGDRPFLSIAKYSAAPANADTEIKSIVDYASHLAHLAGVIDIIHNNINLNHEHSTFHNS